MFVIAPFAHAEPNKTSPLDCLTPGGIACAKLTVESFTSVYSPDERHSSPDLTVWVVATVKCTKRNGGGLFTYDNDTPSFTNREHAALRSGQIANLRLKITLPENFEVSYILGKLYQRQIRLGETWYVIFKLRPVNKIAMPLKAFARPDGCYYMDPVVAAHEMFAAHPGKYAPPKTEDEMLMDRVEKMLTPEEEIVASVEYDHTLFPTSTTCQESASTLVRAITEAERRQRQFYKQQTQARHQQRGTSTHTTNADLDRNSQMSSAICQVLGEGVGAKWPKNPKKAVKYTIIPPADALQLLYDFREFLGSTLPQDVTEEMDGFKDAYTQVRKERQEGSFTRKSLKVVFEMGARIARRAIPTSSTFSGRYNYHAPSLAEPMQPLNGSHYTAENSVTPLADSARQPLGNGVSRRDAFELDRADYSLQTTLKDITNGTSRRLGVAARFMDNFPIVGRRRHARTDAIEKEADLEKGVREEDEEIRAI